jgi:peptidoglycan/LPS O-acetylase OafA/YrhL
MGRPDSQIQKQIGSAARDLRLESGVRLPELDGLRGTAILMVFLLHYVGNSQNNIGQLGTPLYRFAQIFRLGWSGVDLFFVLSGFLIGGILLDAHDSSSYFRTFYIRRAHRILPVYYAWITIFAAVGYVGAKWIEPQNPAAFAISVPMAVYYLFLQNLIFAPMSHFSHYGISVAWSLAVEEQFYLVAPWLIRRASRRRLTQILIACIVGAPILRALIFSRLQNGHDAAYILTPCRADALAIGMLVAVAWRTQAKSALANHVTILKIALGIFLCGAMAMVKWLPGPRTAFQSAYQYSWLAAMYACTLLVALLDRQGILARLMRCRFLREWGRVSYCVYLIHLGILAACSWILLGSLPRIYDWPGVFVTLLSTGMTWGIAQLSWKYFEKPLIDRGHAMTQPDRVSPYDSSEQIEKPVSSGRIVNRGTQIR